MWKQAAFVLAVVSLNCVPLAGQTHSGPSIHAFGFGDVNFVTTQRDDANGFVNVLLQVRVKYVLQEAGIAVVVLGHNKH